MGAGPQLNFNSTKYKSLAGGTKEVWDFRRNGQHQKMTKPATKDAAYFS